MPIYMKVAGIEGDVTAEGFEKWFEVFAFSWGETNPVIAFGGGGGTGRVQMSDFNVFKRSGKGSPPLFLACASGELLPAVQVVVTNNSTDQHMVIQRWALDNVRITSFQVSGAGGEVPTESLSLCAAGRSGGRCR